MRSCCLLALTLLLGACSFVDQIQLSSPGLSSNKIYLNRMDVVTVGTREAHRYACVNPPLLCTSRGVVFECHCP